MVDRAFKSGGNPILGSMSTCWVRYVAKLRHYGFLLFRAQLLDRQRLIWAKIACSTNSLWLMFSACAVLSKISLTCGLKVN
jgi:hypothetical protein